MKKPLPEEVLPEAAELFSEFVTAATLDGEVVTRDVLEELAGEFLDEECWIAACGVNIRMLLNKYYDL